MGVARLSRGLLSIRMPWLLAWVILLVVGCVFLWFGIDFQSVWSDEYWSMALVGHSWSAMLSLMADDVHPPLYFLMLKGWTALFSDSVVAMRSLSALGVLALAALGPLSLRRMTSDLHAFIYSALCLFTPMMLMIAREIRMYPWMVFFVTAAFLAGFLAYHQQKKAPLVRAGIWSLAAALTHHFGLITVAVGWGIFLLAVAWKRRAFLRATMIVALGTVAAYVPFLIVLFSQTKRVQTSYWIDAPTIRSIAETLAYPFGYKAVFTLIPVILWVLALALVIWGVIRAYRRKEEARSLFLSATAIYMLTFLVVLVVSWTVVPILYPRFLLVTVGLFFIVLANGLIVPNNISWSISLLVMLLLADSQMITDVYSREQHSPMVQLQQTIWAQADLDDPIIHCDFNSYAAALHYLPEYNHYFYLPKKTWDHGNLDVFRDVDRIGNDPTPWIVHHPTIWVVDVTITQGYQYLDRLLQHIGYRQKHPNPQDIQVYNEWFLIRFFEYGRVGQTY